MKTRIPWMATALVAVVAAIRPAAGQPNVGDTATVPSLEQRFGQAVSYEAFVAGDTARRGEWEATYALAASVQGQAAARVASIGGHWHLLVIAESWCTDAVNSVPYLARLARDHPTLELRLLRKAEAPELLTTHQLDGRSATPVVILLDDRFQERGSWIEQPAPLRALVRSKEGRVCEETLKEAVRDWRRADQGQTVVDEVISLIERASTQPAAPSH